MLMPKPSLPRIAKILGAGAVAFLVAGAASAAVFDFARFVSGGGGGSDPQKKQIATGMGRYICVDVGASPVPPGNSVRFTIWTKIPQPAARIRSIAFDLGRHSNLLSGVAVTLAPPDVKAAVIPAQAHPFLSGLSPEYWVDIPTRGHVAPGGMTPGKLIVVTATLGPGKTLNDVLTALNEGLNPATAATGLRVGVIVLYLLGGPPPGTGTIQDDGGFVTTNASPAQCQRS